MLFGVNRNPSPSELRKFGLAMLLGFGVIGGLLWWRTGTVGVAIALWCIAGLLCAISWLTPQLGRKVYVGWMVGGAAIGKIMLPVFLTLAFFILLPPFSLIRLADPLRLKLKKDGTYWERHKPHEATIERMMRPF